MINKTAATAYIADVRTREMTLHRYPAEFDFRDSNRIGLGYNDDDCADILLPGMVGKRLTYQQTGAA